MTLQVAVLTADMLVSVFVDVLNSTDSWRRLLVSKSGLATTNLWVASQQNHPADASTPYKVTGRPAGNWQRMLPNLSPDGQLLAQQLGLKLLQRGAAADAMTLLASPEPHTAATNALHAPPMLIQPVATVVTPKDHATGQHEAEAVQSLLLRHLLQRTASTATFPLASLLLFKKNLVLAAFTSTSGCSNDSIAELFYQASALPDSLEGICGADSRATDRSLDAALLAMSNSSVPLLQVIA